MAILLTPVEIQNIVFQQVGLQPQSIEAFSFNAYLNAAGDFATFPTSSASWVTGLQVNCYYYGVLKVTIFTGGLFGLFLRKKETFITPVVAATTNVQIDHVLFGSFKQLGSAYTSKDCLIQFNGYKIQVA